MEHRIVLAWEDEDIEKADRVWQSVEGQNPVSVAALEDLVNTFTAMYDAHIDLVRDDRYYDWMLRVLPRSSGTFVFPRGPYVIPGNDRDAFLEFVNMNRDQFHLIRDAIVWHMDIPVEDSTGYRLPEQGEAYISGIIHPNSVQFDRGGYTGIPGNISFLPLARRVDAAFSWNGHEPDFSWETAGNAKARQEKDEAEAWEKQWEKRADKHGYEIGKGVTISGWSHYVPIVEDVIEPGIWKLTAEWVEVDEEAGGIIVGHAYDQCVVKMTNTGEVVLIPYHFLDRVSDDDIEADEWAKQWEKVADGFKFQEGDEVVFTKKTTTLSNGLHQSKVIEKGTKGKILQVQRWYFDKLCKVTLSELNENSSIADALNNMVWTEQGNLELIDSPQEWAKQWEKHAGAEVGKPVMLLVSGEFGIWEAMMSSRKFQRSIRGYYFAGAGSKGTVMDIVGGFGMLPRAIVKFETLPERPILLGVPLDKLEIIDDVSPEEWERQWEKKASPNFEPGDMAMVTRYDRYPEITKSYGDIYVRPAFQTTVAIFLNDVVEIRKVYDSGRVAVKVGSDYVQYALVPLDRLIPHGPSPEEWERQWEKKAGLTKRAVDMREWFKLRYEMEPEQNQALYNTWKWRDEQGMAYDRMDAKGLEIYRKLQRREMGLEPQGSVKTAYRAKIMLSTLLESRPDLEPRRDTVVEVLPCVGDRIDQQDINIEHQSAAYYDGEFTEESSLVRIPVNESFVTVAVPNDKILVYIDGITNMELEAQEWEKQWEKIAGGVQ